jgi:hypothetical protein
MLHFIKETGGYVHYEDEVVAFADKRAGGIVLNWRAKESCKKYLEESKLAIIWMVIILNIQKTVILNGCSHPDMDGTSSPKRRFKN